MPSTWQIPAYVALARQAAATLGASNDATVRAILAQWQCEQPNPAPWPPIHNNPGNLSRAIGWLGGPPPPLATSAPGAWFLYAYPTPEAGALAYATYLLRSARYPAAIAAARRGDAAGFLTAVCNAGYGTRLACCLGLLPQVTLPTPAPAVPRWRCVRGPMRIRSGLSVSAPVVGYITLGQVVAGQSIAGGAYTMPGGPTSSLWIALGGGRYVAAAGFTRIS